MSLDIAMNAWGWALLNFVWQGAVIGGVTALLLAVLRGAPARWRYAVCALSLLLCLALPLAQCLDLAMPGEGDFTTELQPLAGQMPALVTAWALGAGLMLTRLALGLAWVGRARRRSTPAPAEWQARLDSLARRLGLSRAVSLRLLPGLAGPIAMGALKPCVLLPAALLSRLPVDLIEALLAHELAHVRRWDYLANLLQSAVEALLFFHPVVWWLSARMRAERELVADQISAELLGDSRRLALALHALAELDGEDKSPRLAPAARGGDLLGRIEHLLAPRPQATGWKLALPALLIAAASFVAQAKGRNVPDTPTPAVQAAQAAPSEVPPAQQLRLPVNAKHVLVVDDATGKVLMARDADAVVPIASLTKLLTAMVVLDAKQDPNEKLRITNDDVDTLKHSRSRVRVGTQMSRLAALEMALMESENRAAFALARNFPGGEAGFVKAMQAKLRALGLSRTSITDPTGLSPANTSTATEMAAITAAAARYGEIERITSVKKAMVPVDGRSRELHNTNRLVGAKGWDIRLSKTGYTEEAGRCLAMRMMNGKRPVTVVLLDADGSAHRLRDAAMIRKSLARQAS
ncbi:MAG: serine hydrolase [Burkholderiales bacterium]|nr:serine hydrolase [Burkholderiales bacterium]